MATTYLSKTLGTPTDNKKWTFSCWLKYTKYSGTYPNSESPFFHADGGSTTSWGFVGFDEANQLILQNRISNANVGYVISNAKYADPSAWYNFVAVYDSANSTAADRQILYVNGERITSLAGETQAPLNTASNINSAIEHRIGRGHGQYGSKYFGGLMSYVTFVDGTVYPPTAFGEVDAASGIWKINTAPSVTYGNNGFSLKMDTTSPGSDTSGNNNTFTASGTPTLAQDNCSNNLVTMNPLDNFRAGGTFSNGNNTVVSRNAGYSYNTSTVGVNKGKFYWECKWSATPTGSGSAVQIGIAKRQTTSTTNFLGSNLYSYAYQGDSGAVRHNDSTVITYNTYAIGDIIGIALDMDNNRLYFSKNGVFQNSSNPADGTNPISILAPDSTLLDTGFYFAGFGDGNDSLQQTAQFNFGNGFFGVTAVSSSNADAAGHGLFEYAVPTGYFTLNTKNLNTYG